MSTLQSKSLASLSEAYCSIVYAFKNMPTLKRALKNNTIDKHFNSRIMLAVTEVNGCAVCSYGHTTLALESGMSHDEISQLLGGETTESPKEEQAALLFAQHVAENRGAISKKAWHHLNTLYQPEEAQAILASTQVIMMGNTFGIPIGSFLSRLTQKKAFKKDPRTTLPYEIMFILSLLAFLPVSVCHSIISTTIKQPKAKFQ